MGILVTNLKESLAPSLSNLTNMDSLDPLSTFQPQTCTPESERWLGWPASTKAEPYRPQRCWLRHWKANYTGRYSWARFCYWPGCFSRNRPFPQEQKVHGYDWPLHRLGRKNFHYARIWKRRISLSALFLPKGRNLRRRRRMGWQFVQ